MSFVINCLKYSFVSLSILVIAGLFLSIHLQQSFPNNIKNVEPQLFESHPARDLQPVAKSLQIQEYQHVNDKLIGRCQDFEMTKNDDIYCVNERSQIIKINQKNNQTEKLYDVGKGISYGSRLSRDETKLFFVNSQLGMCEYNIVKKQFRSLVSQFQGQKLLALNSIQTHPQDENILYLTQSTTKLPMYLHTIQILLNNPFGRVFQFNITSGQLEIIADGLYFPNGVVYQVNTENNQPTLLIAETNRHRVIRVYLQGEKRGQKQIVIDKLDLFVDNMKLSFKGELWIAGPTARDPLSPIADRTPLLRKVLSRLPPSIFPYLINTKYFGGIRVTFDEKNNNKFDIDYYLYKKLPQYTLVTTILERQSKMFMSSLFMDGLLVVDLKKVQNQVKSKQETTEEL